MDCCVVCENPSVCLSDPINIGKKPRETPSEKFAKSEEQFYDFCKILKIPKGNVRKYLSLGDFRKLLLIPFCSSCNILARDLVNFHNQQLNLEEEVFNLQKALLKKLKELAKPAKNVNKLFNNLKDLSNNAEKNKNRLQAEKSAQKNKKKKPVLNEKEIIALKQSFNLAFKAGGRTEVKQNSVSTNKRHGDLIENFPHNFIATPEFENCLPRKQINTDIEYEEEPLIKIETDDQDVQIKDEQENEYDEEPEVTLNAFGISAEANQINLLNFKETEHEEENITEDPLRLEEDLDSDSGDYNQVESEAEDQEDDVADKSLSEEENYSPAQKRHKPAIGYIEPYTKVPEDQSSTDEEEEKNESERNLRPKKMAQLRKWFAKHPVKKSNKSESSEEDADDSVSDWSEEEREYFQAGRTPKERSERTEKRLKPVKLTEEMVKRGVKKIENLKCVGPLDFSTHPEKLFFNGIELIEKEDMNYECGKCGQLVRTIRFDRLSYQLATLPICRHILEKHFGGYKCLICLKKKIFKSFSAIEEHVRRHAQPLVECEICGMGLRDQYLMGKRMAYHKWTHKNESEKAEAIASGIIPPEPLAKNQKRNYLCTHCGKALYSPKELARHEETHLDPEERKKKKIPCPQCGKLFFKATLYCHQRFYHKKETLRKFGCKFCERNFVSQGILADHVRRAHTNERPFKCDYEGCGGAFHTLGYLTQHKKIHTGQRKVWSCKLCPYENFKYDRLKKHVKNCHEEGSTANSEAKQTRASNTGHEEGQPEISTTAGPEVVNVNLPVAQNVPTLTNNYSVMDYNNYNCGPQVFQNPNPTFNYSGQPPCF